MPQQMRSKSFLLAELSDELGAMSNILCRSIDSNRRLITQDVILLSVALEQTELRKAALERSGGDGTRKVVLPAKEEGSKEARVLDVDHLTQTQVMS